MIQIEVDTQGQMVAIGQRLERLAFEAPDVLRLSLNAAARQVRKQLTRDVADTYTVDASVLKDSSKGAPRLQTAKPGKMEAVIRLRPGSAGARGGPYTVRKPIGWSVQNQPTTPYYYGIVEFSLEIPNICPEVPFT